VKLLEILALIWIAAVVAALHGCAAGPQLPITSVVISCTWHAEDGGTASDNDCLIDRSSADPRTTGNQIDRSGNPSTSVSVPVGGQ
jgi:hypothetical protein